nr:leucine-rich repeat receptor-like serine/threonine-protein kinase BAM1 [Ipomoea batatas]
MKTLTKMVLSLFPRQNNARVLSLTNNRLKGSISASIFALSNLHTLNLSRNELTRPVPGVNKMTELRVMILAENQLSGKFLAELPGAVAPFGFEREQAVGGAVVSHAGFAPLRVDSREPDVGPTQRTRIALRFSVPRPLASSALLTHPVFSNGTISPMASTTTSPP